MSIATQAMTVNIQIGSWTGHRLDKEASKEVTERNGADSDAARVNKHIIPKEMLAPIVSAAQAMRNHVYFMTLPWKDNGDRLLVRKLYIPFMEEHAKLHDAYKEAVKHFVEVDYPKARDQASFRMGALFNPDDYPAPDAIARKFYCNLDIDAVTEAGDFRVEMDAGSVKALQTEITQAVERRIANAMKDVWHRLATTLKLFAERCAADGKLRSATLDNLRELLDMLPALNILGDQELENIREQLLDALGSVDIADLRKDRKVRDAIASDARKIMEDMGGFMKAFG